MLYIYSHNITYFKLTNIVYNYTYHDAPEFNSNYFTITIMLFDHYTYLITTLALYSDVIHSFDWKADVEHDGGALNV